MKKIFLSIVLLTFITCLIGGFIEAFARPDEARWFIWGLFSAGVGFACFVLTDYWSK